MENLDQNVHVYGVGKAFVAVWDGKEYPLNSKEPVEVKRGIARHWEQKHKIRIEDVPREVIDQRTPVNPLDTNNRGSAFAGLQNVGNPEPDPAAQKDENPPKSDPPASKDENPSKTEDKTSDDDEAGKGKES